MYQIILHHRAVDFYDKLSEKQKNRLNEAIDSLKNNPLFGRNIKKLRGKLKGKYRYKVGPLRVVYMVSRDKNLVIVESIGPRGSIY